jgi:hypothetical protein
MFLEKPIWKTLDLDPSREEGMTLDVTTVFVVPFYWKADSI